MKDNEVRKMPALLFFSFMAVLLLISFSAASVALKPSLQPSKQAVGKRGAIDHSLFSGTYTFTQLSWSGSNTLRGGRAATTFYLSVPKQWQYTRAKLHLIFSHSPLLHENSTLTLEVNGTPISSLPLTKENSASSTWDIELPPEQLVKNWVTLKFIGFMKINTDRCQEEDSASNWIVLSPDSTLTLEYKKLAFNPDLALLPYPFIYTNPLEPLTSLLVVPPNPSIRDLEPALQIVRTFGAQLNDNQINLSAVLANTITEQQRANNNLLVVGKTDQFSSLDLHFLQDIAAKAIKNNQETAVDRGIINMISSPWDPFYGVLAITGSSDLALEKAVSAFNDPQFTPFLYGQSVLIAEEKGRVKTADQTTHQLPVSLKTMGYDDQAVLGLGQNTLSYSVVLPNNQIADTLTLNTVFSHSVFKAGDHSLLTVAVNGVQQASQLLVSSNERNASWSIKIPGDVLNPGKNLLTYTFDLHIPQEGCATRYYYQTWGVIHAASTLKISFFSELPRVILSRFPLAFSTKTLMVVPDKLSIQEINALVQFFLKIGVLLGYDAPSVRVLGASEVTPSVLKNQSNVFIGTVQNNPWIAQAMASASLRIEQGNIALYGKNNHVSFINKVPLGLVELIESPWNSSFNTLLITGTKADAVGWAMRLLTADKLRSQLTGNIATINEKEVLANFETRSDSWSLKQGLSKRNIRAFGVAAYQNLGFVVIFIFLLIVIPLAILGFYIRRKK